MSSARPADSVGEERIVEFKAKSPIVLFDVPQELISANNPQRSVDPLAQVSRPVNAAISISDDPVRSRAFWCRVMAGEQVLGNWLRQYLIHHTDTPPTGAADPETFELFDVWKDDPRLDAVNEFAIDSALEELFVDLV